MGSTPSLPATKVQVFIDHPGCLRHLHNVVNATTEVQTRCSGNMLSLFPVASFLAKDSVSLASWVQAELTQGVRPHRAPCQLPIPVTLRIYSLLSLRECQLAFNNNNPFHGVHYFVFTEHFHIHLSFNHFLLYIPTTFSWYLFSVTFCLA